MAKFHKEIKNVIPRSEPILEIGGRESSLSNDHPRRTQIYGMNIIERGEKEYNVSGKRCTTGNTVVVVLNRGGTKYK